MGQVAILLLACIGRGKLTREIVSSIGKINEFFSEMPERLLDLESVSLWSGILSAFCWIFYTSGEVLERVRPIV